jgi:hypothetical protein
MRSRLRICAALAAAAGLAACDPLPITQLRNRAPQPLTVRSVARVRVATAGMPKDATVAPGANLRFLHAPQRLTLKAGGCELTYDLPAQDLSNALGAVNGLEVGPDLRIYLVRQRQRDGSYKRLDGKSQPSSWPVAPVSKICS